MFFFYRQAFMKMVNCIFMMSKKMDEIHRRITEEQQDGKPYRQYVFDNISFHFHYKCNNNPSIL